MGKKRLNYDDDALVEMISDGQMTYKAIGQKLGISEILVKQIAQGRRRKELGQRFWDSENGIMTEARRIASQYARHMVMEQIRLGLKGQGEPARRAREFILKFAVSSRPRRKDVPGERDRRSEEILQMARDIGVMPWEDELDAEREREAMEEEGRSREGLTAENAESAEGEEAGKGATGNRQPATGNRQPATGNRQPATGNRQPATGNRQPAAAADLRNSGQVVTAASMPATGVFPGGAAGAGREGAERTEKPSIREASVEHPLSIP